MFVGKRGLSDIVTNILIILLVLVAVGILWFFVRPTLERGASGVQGIDQCLIVDVKATGCTLGTGIVTVNVERGVGEGDLKKINFILFKVNGDSFVASADSSLAVYRSQSVVFGGGSGQVPFPTGITASEVAKVNVAAVVGEQLRECRPLNQPVNCA